MKFLNTVAAKIKNAAKLSEKEKTYIMMALDELSMDKEFQEMFEQETDKVIRIAQNMTAHGYDDSQPIIITPDKIIIDGHSRYLACKQAGIKKVPVVIKEFESKEAAKDYERHLQLDRRNLSDAEIYRFYVEETSKTDENGKRLTTDVKIAETLHISPRQLSKIREVETKASKKVFEAYKNGEITLNKAYTLMKAETAPAVTEKPEATTVELAPKTTKKATPEVKSETTEKSDKSVEEILEDLQKDLPPEKVIEVNEEDYQPDSADVIHADKVILKQKDGIKRVVKNRNGQIDGVFTMDFKTPEGFKNHCRRLEQEGFRIALLYVQKELVAGKTLNDILKEPKFSHLHFENAEFTSAEESVLDEILKETKLFKNEKVTA